MWPFPKSKPLVPQWGYASHEYVGIENNNHVYRVTFARGTEREEHIFRFHARHVEHGKDDAKLKRFFTAEARKLNASAT